MKFVGRKQEMSHLNRLVHPSRASVAVLWGRRRIGKTRLLLEWVQKHRGVYYTADESTAPIQRKYFALAMEPFLPGFSEVDYPDWTTFFLRIARDAIRAKWRGPIVIDELPYLISTSPELPSILQRFIDHEAKKAKLVLVLCGSSQRMMQKAILDSSAPLYGRADEIIKLGPILPYHMKEALKLKKTRELIESYSIWGGIPRYWELVEKSRESFLQTIDTLVLNPMGPLNDESNRLLRVPFCAPFKAYPGCYWPWSQPTFRSGHSHWAPRHVSYAPYPVADGTRPYLKRDSLWNRSPQFQAHSL